MGKAPLKYPGSKWRIADWIVEQIPPHEIYVEPFFGSGAVFFTKPESKLEVINDVDQNVINFFKACRDHPDELARAIELTPFARAEFEAIQEPRARAPLHLTGDEIEDARRFSVRCWQGTGNRLGQRVGWKHDVSQIKSNTAHQWANLPDRIAPIAERLKRAQIECTDAVDLIPHYNSQNTLIYADPPYMGETRRSGIYAHEMGSADEHVRLIRVLKNHKGPVIISGYDSPLYNSELANWEKTTINARIQSNAWRQEVVWRNF